MNIPLKTLVEALQALKSAEAYIDKQPATRNLWCEVMQSRVSLELYVNRALEGQTVEVTNAL
jgi:hypothetical protein